jgi:NADP-dependent 3-hydroxy acid dehydrogenase YdfG
VRSGCSPTEGHRGAGDRGFERHRRGVSLVEPRAITYIITRPRHVAVNEVLIRPTEQER